MFDGYEYADYALTIILLGLCGIVWGIKKLNENERQNDEQTLI